MIKRLLTAATENVASAAALVAFFSILSRFMGLIRDNILVRTLGVGDSLDAYYTAFRVPDTVFQLLIVGTLSASFIPIFSKHFANDESRAWKYASAMLNGTLLLFIAVAAGFAIFAPQLTPLIAWGFPDEKQAMVVDMMRILLIGQCFFAASMVFGSMLQATRRFFLYSIAPIVYNAGIIHGAVIFVPFLGPMGLAVGTAFGALMHAVIQGVGVFALGYKYRPRLAFDADIRKTVLQMGPRTVSLAVTQINFLLMTSIASTLVGGSVAMLQFAYNLNFFPIGVVAVSYAIAAFPTLCSGVDSQGRATRAFVDAFSSTVRQVLFFLVPATISFLLLRAQIVRLVLGAKGFSWDATELTADALAIFALSFCAQGMVFVLVRGFFAFEKTAVPFFAALIVAALNIVLAWYLAPMWGLLGLAAAFSIAAVVQCALLVGFLRVLAGPLDSWMILRSLGITSFAGTCMAAVMYQVKLETVKVFPLTTFGAVFIQFMVSFAAGAIVFIGIAALLRSPELLVIVSGLRRKMLKVAAPKEIAQSETVTGT